MIMFATLCNATIYYVHYWLSPPAGTLVPQSQRDFLCLRQDPDLGPQGIKETLVRSVTGFFKFSTAMSFFIHKGWVHSFTGTWNEQIHRCGNKWALSFRLMVCASDGKLEQVSAFRLIPSMCPSFSPSALLRTGWGAHAGNSVCWGCVLPRISSSSFLPPCGPHYDLIFQVPKLGKKRAREGREKRRLASVTSGFDLVHWQVAETLTILYYSKREDKEYQEDQDNDWAGNSP